MTSYSVTLLKDLPHRGMTEQERDALAVMGPPARLGQRGADINRLELVALFLLAAVGHRVRDHDPTELAAVERLDGVATEDAVRDDGHDLPRAVFHHGVGSLDQRSTGVGHIVDQYGDSVLDIPHQHHA